MTLTRRNTLAILGGGFIAAAGGATFAVTRPLTEALAPWSNAGTYADPRMQALSYAILAPNPHNRQPWLVDLRTEGEATLYVDTDRLLPHTDPFSRQITIGLGCFLEVLRMAAAETGLRADATLFPGGSDPLVLDDRPVATITFTPDPTVQPDPLFAHILTRRSLKEPFDTSRLVAATDIAAIAGVAKNGTTAGGSSDMADVEWFRDLTSAALTVETETPHTYKESVDLFRIGRAEVTANPDGIDFSGPMFETLHLTGMMTREAALDPNGTIFTQGMAVVLENAQTAMGHVWLTTATNTRADQIRTGADWVRTNLQATALGLGFHPLSQALQEYPEMATHYSTLHDRLAPGGETVQMLARVGFGPTVDASPRWSLENKIVEA